VPLYNALPLPFGEPVVDPLSGRSVAAVNVLPILEALRKGADQLASINLPVDAPPAFILDANRLGESRKMEPDEFDNRSICFTTDFPSANFLAANGIKGVLFVQRTGLQPQKDLAHVLRRWQEAGIFLQRLRLDSEARPASFQVERPSWYGAMFQRALYAFGFRRATATGFGAWVPDSPAGG